MSVIGLDIGGANLKAAHIDGECLSRPFPLWKQPERLAEALEEFLQALPPANALAVTMTGELADCFPTKRDGVAAILDAVDAIREDRDVGIWSTGGEGEFVPSEFAREFPLLVAAANWHALASWFGRLSSAETALLIDIGTTTTDIIPLQKGRPVPSGRTDLERLQSGELEYSGIARTPLAAIAHSAPFRHGNCALAAELFATTLDIYLLLGDVAENPASCDTANGRPATIPSARDRLARMLCADVTEIRDDELERISRFLKDVQMSRIRGAIDRVLARQSSPCADVLLSGRGEFLAEAIVDRHPRLQAAHVHRLSHLCSPAVAEAACAFALTRLAEEQR